MLKTQLLFLLAFAGSGLTAHADGGPATVVDKQETMAVEVSGKAAEAIWNGLKVQEQSMDPEFYTFMKDAPGVDCTKHTLTGAYECVFTVDKVKGVLK